MNPYEYEELINSMQKNKANNFQNYNGRGQLQPSFGTNTVQNNSQLRSTNLQTFNDNSFDSNNMREKISNFLKKYEEYYTLILIISILIFLLLVSYKFRSFYTKINSFGLLCIENNDETKCVELETKTKHIQKISDEEKIKNECEKHKKNLLDRDLFYKEIKILKENQKKINKNQLLLHKYMTQKNN